MTKIHFRYGSKPLKQFPNQNEMFGGILGGHVYFQVNEYFYGFEPFDEKSFHYFPSRNFNAIFRKESLNDWTLKHKDQKVLTIQLPLTSEQELNLLTILEKYHRQTPYDYAVFGMRCGASSYHILSQIGLFETVSRFQCILSIPYPKFLRKKFIKIAKKNNWKMELKEGTMERTWEKD